MQNIEVALPTVVNLILKTKTHLKKIKKGLYLKTNFNVLASDFEIKIPKVVRNKISQEINITAEYDLIEKL